MASPRFGVSQYSLENAGAFHRRLRRRSKLPTATPESNPLPRAGLAVLAGAALGAPAAAAVINASSAAFGESVSITGAPPVGFTSNVGNGPLPGAAGPPQHDAIGGERLCDRHPFTGMLTSTASSNVDGLPGARTVNASPHADRHLAGQQAAWHFGGSDAEVLPSTVKNVQGCGQHPFPRQRNSGLAASHLKRALLMGLDMEGPDAMAQTPVLHVRTADPDARDAWFQDAGGA